MGKKMYGDMNETDDNQDEISEEYIDEKEDEEFDEYIFEEDDMDDADEDDELTSDDVCQKVYSLAQEGKKAEAVALVYGAVDNYIRMELYRSFKHNSAASIDVEDLYQDVYKEITEHIQNYDPTKKLTTFVKNYIIQARCEYISRVTNIPLYYVQHMNKLRKVDNFYDEKGLETPGLLDYYLETKMPVTTIINCLEYRKGTDNVSLEAQSVEKENERIVESTVSEYKDSPEKIFINNERKNSVIEALVNLPYEQRVMIGFKFPYMMEIVEPNFFIDHPEMREVFNEVNDINDKNNSDKKISNIVIADFLGIPVEQVDRMNIISILEENEQIQNITGKKKRRKKGKEVATIPVDLAIKAIDELEMFDLEEDNGLHKV